MAESLTRRFRYRSLLIVCISVPNPAGASCEPNARRAARPPRYPSATTSDRYCCGWLPAMNQPCAIVVLLTCVGRRSASSRPRSAPRAWCSELFTVPSLMPRMDAISLSRRSP